jgi:hypothetical protein
MPSTLNARAMAARVNAALHKAGSTKTVDAKRVRAWVRDNVAAYDDEGYTAHAYDARTAASIEKGMVAARVASKATTSRQSRGVAASEGRTSRKAPAKRPTRKATSRKATPATPANPATVVADVTPDASAS